MNFKSKNQQIMILVWPKTANFFKAPMIEEAKNYKRPLDFF
jgi:hypothetical protein